jgi:hypothetical protein
MMWIATRGILAVSERVGIERRPSGVPEGVDMILVRMVFRAWTPDRRRAA